MNDIKASLLELIKNGLKNEIFVNEKFMIEIEREYFTLNKSEDINLIFPFLTKLQALWLIIQFEKDSIKNSQKRNSFKELTDLLIIVKDAGFNVKDLNERYCNLK